MKGAAYLDQGDAKRVMVQLKNGETWLAEIDLDGKVKLVKQLSDPAEAKASEPDEEESEEGASEEEQDGEGEGEESEEEPEEIPEPKEMPMPDWGEEGEEGEEIPKAAVGDIEKLIKKMLHRQVKATYEEDNTNPNGRRYNIPKDLLKNLKDNAFNARLSSIMLDNKYDRRVRGRTRGKLDMTRLYKVPTGSRSVFTKKESRKGKQYNVMLLVDESGSMSGAKAWKAAEAAIFLAQAFDGLNINVSIIGFNHNISVHKEFTGKANYPKIYEAIGTMNWGRGAGWNNDWDGMNKAYQMFSKAPEGKNILMMLSDGAPASMKHPNFWDVNGKEEKPPKNTDILDYEQKDERQHLHHLVKANAERVTSIGIGIMQGGWQIPDHEVIHDVDELKKVVIGQLRKHISRG